MKRLIYTGALALPLALAACGSDDDNNTTPAADAAPPDAGSSEPDADLTEFARVSCSDFADPCMQFTATEVAGVQEAVQLLENGATVVLGSGTFDFDNQVTIRGATGVTVTGQGKDVTVLSFANQSAQANGVDAVGDDFTISHLTIEDTVKDGLRVEDSDGVTIQSLKVTWSGGPLTTNGAYGIYPVKVQNVLMEDSEAYNASDAGIYVGQCQNAIVRNNIAKQNVAGIEIENTQFADVYGNVAEDNTGGLVVFDLPGNPIPGRDIRIHDNIIKNNNRANFAPGGTVAEIPAGTGTFALASRRVEIDNNTYENNQTVDIAILHGGAIEPSPANWAIPLGNVVGDIGGLNLPTDGANVYNIESTRVYIHDNTHTGSGLAPDVGMERQLGAFLGVMYSDGTGGLNPVDEVLYDAIEESAFSADDADSAGNSNDHALCLAGNTGATYASMDLGTNIVRIETFLGTGMGSLPTHDDLYRPASPFAPFDCAGFGAVTPPANAE